MDIPFVGPSLRGVSPAWNDQRTQNLMLEFDQSGKRPIALVNSPGKELDSTLAVAPIRGAHFFQDSSYWVAGRDVFRRGIGGSITLIGSIATISGPVSIDSNFTQMMIVDGTATGYTSDGASVVPIADPDFLGGDTVTFIDGRFYVNRPFTGIVQGSDLNSGTSWNPLNIKTAEGKADDLVAVIADEEFLYALGTNTAEVWWNQGTVPFSFQRAANGVLTFGLIASFSVGRADNRIVWLAQDREGGASVVATAGPNTPVIISTPQMDTLMASFPSLRDAYALTYVEAGHSFYQLTFPSVPQTFTFDFATGTWTERERFGLGYDPARGHVFTGSENLVGDNTAGKIYNQRISYFKDDGVTVNSLGTIEKLRTSPIINADERTIFYHSLKLLAETGVANADVTDPTLQLDYSDNLRTFKNQRFLSLGKSGEFQKDLTLWRMGAAVNRIYRMIVTSPCKVRVMGANATVTISQKQRRRVERVV